MFQHFPLISFGRYLLNTSHAPDTELDINQAHTANKADPLRAVSRDTRNHEGSEVLQQKEVTFIRCFPAT